MVSYGDDPWEELWGRISSLGTALGKSKAINVNAEAVRASTKDLVQHYFRSARPELLSLGVDEISLGVLDEPMQDLLRLSNGRNRRSSYKGAIKQLRTARTSLELQRERSVGERMGSEEKTGSRSAIEQRILSTLRQMVPSAALSYEQACEDLTNANRSSYRGSAVEIREALREVLDHLAPDDVVMKSEGFKLEKNATRPTMKQKAKFILKSRGLSSGELSSPQDAINRVEEGTAALARSVYTRGSMSTHVSTTYEQVMHLKMYADGVLAELLQVHALSDLS